jgi:CubicO group peptidase (beta-lactamase class C family)
MRSQNNWVTVKFLVIILGLIPLQLNSQNLLSIEKKINSIDSLVNLWKNHGQFNGGIAIQDHGNVIYRNFAGFAGFEDTSLISNTTLFNLASVSKPFTAIAILQLAEKKKIKLDNTYSSYLPDFPYHIITVRNLLSHTSGLPEVPEFESTYIKQNPDEILTNEKIYSRLIELSPDLKFKPGESFQYNNLNYILLSLLIEKQSGIPYYEYMEKKIFKPAGMMSSYVRKPDSPNTPRFIIPTYFESEFKPVDSLNHRLISTNYNYGGTFGDNNIVSNIDDLFQFDKALDKGRLISLNTLKESITPAKLNDGKSISMGIGTRSYALGWNVNEKNSAGKHVVFHDGSLVGLTVVFFKVLDDDQTIIMFENKGIHGFYGRFNAVTNVLWDLPVRKFSFDRSLVRVYGEALVNKGSDYAITLFNELKTDTNYYFSESEMNDLGYELLNRADFQGHDELALEVFKINTLLNPESFNVYDSYAEGLMKVGKMEEAIRMYKKSLLLNPENENALKIVTSDE